MRRSERHRVHRSNKHWYISFKLAAGNLSETTGNGNGKRGNEKEGCGGETKALINADTGVTPRLHAPWPQEVDSTGKLKQSSLRRTTFSRMGLHCFAGHVCYG